MKRSYLVVLAILFVQSSSVAHAAAFDQDFDAAVRGGSVFEVRAAIARGADLSQRDSFDNTPLHAAAEAQRGEVVRVLLAAGADVNATNTSGETPLHRVLGFDVRWAQAIEPLIEAKRLNVDAADKKGRTLLSIASEAPDLKWAKRLLERGAKDSIYCAVARGDAAALAALLDAGADVNAADTDETGASALMMAARHGRLDVLRDLIRRGAKVDAPDKSGGTALMHAAFAGQVEAIDALLELGADPNLVDRDQQTFIDYAVTRIRHRNGHESEKADALAARMLADPRAKPPLRAVALLRQADVAAWVADGPRTPVKDLKQAEALYRKAIAEAPKTQAGISAAWKLGQLLKTESRPAAMADVLIPLLVEDVTEPDGIAEPDALVGGRRIVWAPKPDFRHAACVEIADAYVKLQRYAEAVTYARLARDKFTYKTFCGTGLAEYLQSVDDRVKKLEKTLSIARVEGK